MGGADLKRGWVKNVAILVPSWIQFSQSLFFHYFLIMLNNYAFYTRIKYTNLKIRLVKVVGQ